MNRFTFSIPEQMNNKLNKQNEATGIPKSEIIRQALKKELNGVEA